MLWNTTDFQHHARHCQVQTILTVHAIASYIGRCTFGRLLLHAQACACGKSLVPSPGRQKGSAHLTLKYSIHGTALNNIRANSAYMTIAMQSHGRNCQLARSSQKQCCAKPLQTSGRSMKQLAPGQARIICLSCMQIWPQVSSGRPVNRVLHECLDVLSYAITAPLLASVTGAVQRES